MITQDHLSLHVIELIIRLLEAELRKKIEKTREMEEEMRADRAAMGEKENEVLILMRERDQKIDEKKAVDELVSRFLEAEDNNNFDAQKDLKNQIVALMTNDEGTGMNGENIGELDNAENQDDKTGRDGIVGNDGDSE